MEGVAVPRGLQLRYLIAPALKGSPQRPILLSFHKEFDDSRMTGETFSLVRSLLNFKKIPPLLYGMTI